MKKQLLLFLLSSFSIVAQPPKYEEIFYDINYIGAEQYSLAPRTGTSHFLSSGYYGNSGFVYEVDSAGNMLWNKTFSYAVNTYQGVQFNSMVATSDSGFALTGQISDTSVSRICAALVKLKPNGDTAWCKMITNTTHHLYGLSIAQSVDSGFAVCGYANPVAGGPPYSKIFIAGTDKIGNLSWIKLMYSGNQGEYAYSVRATSDSGYVVCGQTSWGYGGCFIKLNKNGAISWTKNYMACNSGFSILDCGATAHGYLLQGTTQGDNVFLRTDLSGSLLSYQAFSGSGGGTSMNHTQPKLRKRNSNSYYSVAGGCGGSIFYAVDSLGNVQTSEMLMINVADAYLAKDGGYLIAGNGPMCAIKSTNVTWDHMGLIKTDSAGISGGCTTLASTWPSSPLISVGPVTFTTATTGASGFVKLKLGAASPTTQTGCVGWTGDVHQVRTGEIKVYPQPAGYQITIESGEPATISLYNITGALVKTYATSESYGTLDVSDVCEGVYLLRITTNQRVFARKILIAR